MSVNIEIKQTGNEIINITVEEIAEIKNLNYGTSDVCYTLKAGETGQYTVLYDPKRIGRGFDVSVNNGDVSMHLPYPSTAHEIELFYSLTEKICHRLGMGYFFQDEEVVTIDRINDCTENSIFTSTGAIRNIEEKILGGENESFVIFGALNPITVGINEVKEIGGTIHGFENFLNRIQQKDVFYINPKFFQRRDKSIYGVYFVGENIASVMPLKAHVPFNKLDGVDSFFVRIIPDQNDIPYEEFISNIRVAEYYDHNHIIVNLDEKTICELVDSYTTDMTTKKRRRGLYFGKILDNGRNHSRKVQEMELATEELSGYNHLAVFLRWACEHNLLGERLLKELPQLPHLINDPQVDMRIIIHNEPVFDGCVKVLHFNEAGRKFAQQFYVFGSKGFPHCVDLFAESVLGSEKYNCEEYKDEAYLFVPYNEEYYQGLSAYIDEAWQKFNEK